MAATGDPDTYGSGSLFMEYREIGGSTSTTSSHTITTQSIKDWAVTVDSGKDWESRGALTYDSTTIYGDWVSTYDVPVDDGCSNSPASGAGTVSNPYVIMDVCQLNWIRKSLSSHYVLGANIDASQTKGWNGGRGWTPIGHGFGTPEPPSMSDCLTGSFDGKNYTISNLFINRPGGSNNGLFGGILSGVVVRNVNLHNVNITGDHNNGAIVGTVYGGIVANCYSSGSVIGTVENSWRTGGLVGWMYGGTITRCASSCSVSGYHEAGGLLGDLDGGTVSVCYATGNIHASWKHAGGLIGQNDCVIDTLIENCYARGNVTGAYGVGGLRGSDVLRAAFTATIRNSYSTGAVSGTPGEVGGLAGIQEDFGGAFIEQHTFWDRETSGTTESAGNGISKSTLEMKTAETFTSVGWNFNIIWGIKANVNNGYPYFGPSDEEEYEIGELINLAVPSLEGAGPINLDHFTVYEVIDSSGQVSGTNMYFEDAFTSAEVSVGYPTMLCVPTSKIHGSSTDSILNPNDCLILYDINVYSGSVSRTITMVNQLITHNITVSGPVMVAVPSKQSGQSEPNLDHYLIYEITSGTSPSSTVTLTDQFTTYTNVSVTDRSYLAVPAKKTHDEEITEIIKNDTYLVCYNTSGDSPGVSVTVSNQTITDPPPIVGDGVLTGLFVRGNEIQAIFEGLGIRSPDFGATWYNMEGLPLHARVIGFNASNPQDSFVAGEDEVYIVDSVVGNIYTYSLASSAPINGTPISISVDMNNIGAIGTEYGLYKTLDFGEQTNMWYEQPVTDVSVGGARYV